MKFVWISFFNSISNLSYSTSISKVNLGRLHYFSHYILTETPASVSEKKFTNLEPLTPGSQFIQLLLVTEVVISSSARLFIASNATEQGLL
jgi:hypothetical protein